MNEVDYFSQEQWSQDYDNLVKELQDLNEGRNKDCWPLVSFGWKDADLEPSGCTGIKAIVSLDDYKISLEIGGHKTFCPEDSDDDQIMYTQQEIINDIGYMGYWSGDDWTIYMADEISVKWIIDDQTLFPDYKKTAQEIIRVAKIAISPFESAMRDAHKEFYKE